MHNVCVNAKGLYERRQRTGAREIQRRVFRVEFEASEYECKLNTSQE